MLVLLRGVEALMKKDPPGGGSWLPGRLVGGAVSYDLPEACVFCTEGYGASMVAHELGHLAWFQLLPPAAR